MVAGIQVGAVLVALAVRRMRRDELLAFERRCLLDFL